MRKAVLWPVAALVSGVVLGTTLGGGLLSVHVSPHAAAIAPIATVEMRNARALPTPTPEPLDTTDDALLLERAGLVVDALKESDYEALADLVHPEKGLTLTPYSTVSQTGDRVLDVEQTAMLDHDDTEYVWGMKDGSGAPIRLTGTEYFARYVFNADYSQAPQIGIDEVLSCGNALENVSDAYPDARFVEYYYPGLDPELDGYDWCSLKVVLEPWHNEWYLVGLIHSEWTI